MRASRHLPLLAAMLAGAGNAGASGVPLLKEVLVKAADGSVGRLVHPLEPRTLRVSMRSTF